jgi:hypothetical protein
MSNATKIHWGRVLLGGLLAELLVFAIVFPVRHFFGQRAFLASILIASAAMPFVFALWVARRIESRFVLHGALVGLVAALIYMGLARGQPQPLLYKVSHGFKIAGGAAGGLLAPRRKAREG